MIEVFKTNVKSDKQSLTLLSKFQKYFPELKINFDLDDCDKILRVEGQSVPFTKIINSLFAEGYFCEILEE
ncbi:MAG: hypothetical protein AB8B72_14310 [Crocinitomicaceae bacterium]